MELPSEPSFSHYKKQCICCEEEGKKMNKEHFYPQWLLKRTKCEKTLLNSPYGKIPGNQLTIPLCEECNLLLGQNLEEPISQLFDRIEAGLGFNDFEADLLIRWMWKLKGMYYWSICNEHWKYGYVPLKNKVLTPIDAPRSRFSIGVALAEDEFENENFGFAPVGLDSFTFWSNVYTVGVFSKISIVVFYSKLIEYVEKNIWSIYTLSDAPQMMNPYHKTHPRTVFKTGTEAVQMTKLYFGQNTQIEKIHEVIALEQRAKIGNPIK